MARDDLAPINVPNEYYEENPNPFGDNELRIIRVGAIEAHSDSPASFASELANMGITPSKTAPRPTSEREHEPDDGLSWESMLFSYNPFDEPAAAQIG